MNWEQEYKSKVRSPREAVLEFVHSGDSIYGGGTAIAGTTIDALFQVISENK